MANTSKRKCNQCGKEYYFSNKYGRRSKYCSYSCTGKSLSGNTRKKKGKSIIKECLYCNIKYTVKASRIATAKYCSRKCSLLGNTTKVNRACPICNNSFEVIACRKSIAKYCSTTCYNANRRNTAKEQRTCKTCGISYPATKGSGKKYCSIKCCNKQKIKDGAPSFAAVRANMKKAGEIIKCERCGFNDHPHILGIHHKDRDRNNNLRENLEVLCPNCHSLEHLAHVCHGFKQ